MAKLVKNPELIACDEVSQILEALPVPARLRALAWLESYHKELLAQGDKAPAGGECKHPGY